MFQDLKIPKWSSALGILISIFMVIIGIIFCCVPMLGIISMEYTASSILLIYGIYSIIRYFSLPKVFKNSSLLASGLLTSAFALVLLFSNPLFTHAIFALAFGIIAFFSAINQFILLSDIKRSGSSSSLYASSAFLNLIIGIFLFISPFLIEWVLTYAISIYLIFTGIALFAESCSSIKN